MGLDLRIQIKAGSITGFLGLPTEQNTRIKIREWLKRKVYVFDPVIL